MIEVSRLLLMILGELLLLSIACAAVISFLYLSKQRRERSAIKQLIGRIKQDSSRRTDETREILQDHFGLSGASLEETVGKIGREEKAYYQTLIDLFLRRDIEALQNLNVDYERSVDVYRTMDLPAAAESEQPAQGADQPDGSADELELLKAENKRLADELQLTMNTMGTMLSEYTQMFAGGVDISLDREHLHAISTSMENKDSPLSGDGEDLIPASAVALESGRDSEGHGAETAMHETPADNLAPEGLDEGLEDLGAVPEDEQLPVIDRDETVAVTPDQGGGTSDEATRLDEEVVNLDDVLEDPASKHS